MEFRSSNSTEFLNGHFLNMKKIMAFRNDVPKPISSKRTDIPQIMIVQTKITHSCLQRVLLRALRHQVHELVEVRAVLVCAEQLLESCVRRWLLTNVHKQLVELRAIDAAVGSGFVLIEGGPELLLLLVRPAVAHR